MAQWHSTSLVIRECKSKQDTTSHPLEWLKLKKAGNKCWRGCEETELFRYIHWITTGAVTLHDNLAILKG